MSDITGILARIDSGDPAAANELLPLVYDELRKLAAARLAHEKPGQTLQATALVHEAYLRLAGENAGDRRWDSRGHFFAAAAEAMRRILVDHARHKGRAKRGGRLQREPLDETRLCADEPDDELLALDEALTRLAEKDAVAAKLVQLRYFAGVPMEQAAEMLGMSARSAYYAWSYARSWLRLEIRG